MVRVVAEKIIQTENLDAFMKLNAEMIAETRKENGCILYAFHQNEDDPTHFSYIETWASRADLEAHFNSEHFKRLVPQLGELSETKSVNIFNELTHE